MIFYFSGTGNSRYAAHLLAQRLGDAQVIDMAYNLLHGPMTFDIDPSQPVGWVFPIHSWGVPPVVLRFIAKASFRFRSDTPGAPDYQFMMCTCGDDIGLAHRMWRQAIAKRHWNPCAAFSLQMPNNYTLLPGFNVDTDDVAAAKLQAAPARIDRIARRIKERFIGDEVVTGSWAWLKTKIVYPLYKSMYMSPRPFKATDKCISCGLCARTCPMENITMTDRHRPAWGNDCAMCLCCYHVCPHHAVAYGRATRGKGRYLCPLK